MSNDINSIEMQRIGDMLRDIRLKSDVPAGDMDFDPFSSIYPKVIIQGATMTDEEVGRAFADAVFPPGVPDVDMDDFAHPVPDHMVDKATPMPPYYNAGSFGPYGPPVDLKTLKQVPMPVDIDLSEPEPAYTFPTWPVFPKKDATFDDLSDTFSQEWWEKLIADLKADEEALMAQLASPGVPGFDNWQPWSHPGSYGTSDNPIPVYQLTHPGSEGGPEYAPLIEVVIETTRKDRAALSRYEKMAKFGEECGELHEAVLYQHRVMQKSGKPKEGVGTVIEEGADVILQVFDILSECYPDLTPAQLGDALDYQLEKKFDKWIATKMDLPSPVY